MYQKVKGTKSNQGKIIEDCAKHIRIISLLDNKIMRINRKRHTNNNNSFSEIKLKRVYCYGREHREGVKNELTEIEI